MTEEIKPVDAADEPDVPHAFNVRETRFVEEYLVDMLSAPAAERAGYTHHTAYAHAHTWVTKRRTACPLNKRHVWDAVKQALADRARETKIDAMFVLQRLVQMVDADPCDIIDEETGAYMSIHDWPLVWRRMLSAADIQELYGKDDNDNQIKIGEIVKYKFIDKLKAYEMLGKHVDVQAFKDHVKVEGQIRIDVDGGDTAL